MSHTQNKVFALTDVGVNSLTVAWDRRIGFFLPMPFLFLNLAYISHLYITCLNIQENKTVLMQQLTYNHMPWLSARQRISYPLFLHFLMFQWC